MLALMEFIVSFFGKRNAGIETEKCILCLNICFLHNLIRSRLAVSFCDGRNNVFGGSFSPLNLELFCVVH